VLRALDELGYHFVYPQSLPHHVAFPTQNPFLHGSVGSTATFGTRRLLRNSLKVPGEVAVAKAWRHA
jgi:hypothetical protein